MGISFVVRSPYAYFTLKEKKNQKKDFAVVAVAQGDGMSALFRQMGAERIVSGGQSANPSIEDFIKAFEKCESEHIIVLPNNKNVFFKKNFKYGA